MKLRDPFDLGRTPTRTNPLSMKLSDEAIQALETCISAVPSGHSAEVFGALIGEVKELRAQVEYLTKERDEALKKYHFMVELAADQHLDGYRELGAREANAENALDAFRKDVDEAFELLLGIANTMGTRRFVVCLEEERDKLREGLDA